ncbi:MAG: NAD(P)/FAD-dependent oxidoreductase [Acholeplasmatales bacterium]|jgi:thioredoxin reductase (NADPH)|nr:NAD(P)/FAD-dependent oxidoreductase [Acholeplasmatales bacterium]
MYDLIIIGAGPIGMYASTLSLSRGIKTLVLESTQIYGGQLNLYLSKDILDIPGYVSIKCETLKENLYKALSSYNPEIIYNTEIMKVNINEDQTFLLETNNGSFVTKKILLTTGAGKYNPITLDIDGMPNKKVSYKLDNPYIYKNKDVAIFGGGDSAVDMANLLVSIAKKVTLVHRRNDFRAKSENVNTFLNNLGNIIKPYVALKLTENENKINFVLENAGTKEKINLEVDNAIVYFGSASNTNVFTNILDYDPSGFKVNSACESSVKGIFVAGNACLYLGKNKNLASGFGEASNIIYTIDCQINPNKHISNFNSKK